MPFLEQKGNIINSFVSRFLPRIPQTNLGGIGQTGVEVSSETVFSDESQKVEMTRSCSLPNPSFEEIQEQMRQNIEAYQSKFTYDRPQLFDPSNLKRVGGHYRIDPSRRSKLRKIDDEKKARERILLETSFQSTEA